MGDYHIPLVPDHTYHVSNRTVGSEKMIDEERNYIFFLGKCNTHICPIAEIFSYSIVPNHFHFLLEIQSLDVVEEYYAKMKKGKVLQADLICDFIMERFSNLLNSYTKAFNKTYMRKGALFIDYLKRDEIEDPLEFLETAAYIHQDAMHHGYCKNLKEWLWNSYNFDFFSSRDRLLKKFGGIDRFNELHQQSIRRNRFEIMEV